MLLTDNNSLSSFAAKMGALSRQLQSRSHVKPQAHVQVCKIPSSSSKKCRVEGQMTAQR